MQRDNTQKPGTTNLSGTHVLSDFRYRRSGKRGFAVLVMRDNLDNLYLLAL